jgi:hypothetical protein
MKKLVLSALCIVLLSSGLVAMAIPENVSSDRLMQLAKDYLQFVHDVGGAQSVQPDDARLETLFAQNLTKIDNRSVLFEGNRDLLLPQMQGFKKEYDPTSSEVCWVAVFDTVLIIPSVETNTVVVYFEWIHMNVGRGTTIALLQCNDNNQIERITDVWAPVQQ